MSHFSVLVINTSGRADVSDQLAKYDENLLVDRYVKYTKDQLIQKEKNEIEQYRLGRYAEFLNDPEEYKKHCKNDSHINYLLYAFPQKLKWTDEQIYQYAIQHLDPDNIGPDGEVYSISNPDSKWDFWEIGGRFSNRLVDRRSFRTNHCLKKNLHNDTFLDLQRYDQCNEFWEDFVESKGNPTDSDNRSLYKWEYYMDRYKTKECYAQIESTFHTYAVLIDGKWFSPGNMGWFGCSDESDDSWIEWVKTYRERFIDPLPEKALLTIVDCHI